MNKLWTDIQELVRRGWRRGEPMFRLGLACYFGFYAILVFVAFFVGDRKTTAALSFVPLVTVILVLVGSRGYAGFVAIFSTTEEGRRVFKAFLTAIAAQMFTGLALSIIPVHRSRFAGFILLLAILVFVLLHFGAHGEFREWGKKWGKYVAIGAVVTVFAFAYFPITGRFLTAKVTDGTVDLALAQRFSGQSKKTSSSSTKTYIVGADWVEVSIPENSKWVTSPNRKVELLLADGRKFIDGPGQKLRVGVIPGWTFSLRSANGTTASVVVSTAPK